MNATPELGRLAKAVHETALAIAQIAKALGPLFNAIGIKTASGRLMAGTEMLFGPLGLVAFVVVVVAEVVLAFGLKQAASSHLDAEFLGFLLFLMVSGFFILARERLEPRLPPPSRGGASRQPPGS